MGLGQRARRGRRVSSVLTAMAIVLAACGGSGGSSADSTVTTGGQTDTQAPGESPDQSTTTITSPEPAGTDIPDPCALLTTDDLEAATGLTFDEGVFNQSLSSEYQSICDWTASGTDFATAQVLLAPDAGGAFETAKSGASSVFTLVDITIPGASDAYATEEGSISGMEVPGYFLQVSYLPPGPGTVLDATTDLATKAVAALGG
jgi:Protein of unknown function (DUF3558)